ncbi:site-specific DNA-methyltransferase [Leisingera sp. NJS201]|uniref:DNA-methyltransferase n=1 Tax=Leisingera sp. NJS201 TaxID=2508306 RepID=UPI0010713647|nr:site-specific DNA-methyltransferase [Leisingera sp. NJS201]QBR36023.1 site-specific DNA-methyltransferase [Leisingera sp. NJS201]
MNPASKIKSEAAPGLTIAQTDALTFLDSLSPASVGGLFADPPYSSGGSQRTITTQTGRKYCGTLSRNTLPDFAGETMDQRSNLRFTVSWLSAARRVIEPGGYFGIFCDWRQLPVFTDAVQIAGLHWKGISVWDKTEGVRPQKGAFRHQCEYIVWGTNGQKKPGANRILPGCFRKSNVTRNKLHQTQKPVEVMDWLLSITEDGAPVLDPFMGSGTTGAAALASGRPFFGCELVPEIYKVAEARLTACLGQSQVQDCA